MSDFKPGLEPAEGTVFLWQDGLHYTLDAELGIFVDYALLWQGDGDDDDNGEPIKKRPASYDATPPRKNRAVTAAELAMIAGVPVDEAGELTPQSVTATLTPNSWTGMFSPWTDDESP